jgi:DNA repair photolyase
VKRIEQAYRKLDPEARKAELLELAERIKAMAEQVEEVKSTLSPPSGLVIYEPSGAAREYSSLACNLYEGCSHKCVYCYAPAATRKKREKFEDPKNRRDFLARLERAAATVKPAEPVLLSFTCDPYPQFDIERGITRQAIEILHRHGHKVSILTKGGSRALRDIDLLGKGDRFGSTLTFVRDEDSKQWEPEAALPGDRMDTLQRFHQAGIETWVSLEPVIEPAQTLELIQRTHQFVDTFKVGKWNHDQRANEIDWPRFATDVVDLLKKLGKPFVIKDALKPYVGQVA